MPHGDCIVDSTPIKLCLPIRIKRFKAMQKSMGNTVNSAKIIFGFKIHIATNAEDTTAVNF
ncbi:MAG: hypothetical protein LBI69_02075 [Puniceicoccales bacterium]|nr:hypothetical protein [Puniceicoccales bacterium]